MYGSINVGGFGVHPGDRLFGADFGKSPTTYTPVRIFMTDRSTRDLGFLYSGGRISEHEFLVKSDYGELLVYNTKTKDYTKHNTPKIDLSDVSIPASTSIIGTKGRLVYLYVSSYRTYETSKTTDDYWISEIHTYNLGTKEVKKVDIDLYDEEIDYLPNNEYIDDWGGKKKRKWFNIFDVKMYKNRIYIYREEKRTRGGGSSSWDVQFLVVYDLNTKKQVLKKEISLSNNNIEGWGKKMFVADDKGLYFRDGFIRSHDGEKVVGLHHIEYGAGIQCIPTFSDRGTIEMNNNEPLVVNDTPFILDGTTIKYSDIIEIRGIDRFFDLHLDDDMRLKGWFQEGEYLVFRRYDFMNYIVPDFDDRPWWER